MTRVKKLKKNVFSTGEFRLLIVFLGIVVCIVTWAISNSSLQHNKIAIGKDIGDLNRKIEIADRSCDKLTARLDTMQTLHYVMSELKLRNINLVESKSEQYYYINKYPNLISADLVKNNDLAKR